VTTSEHSAFSGFSPRRRSLLLGGASTAALAATLGYAGKAAADEPADPPPFEFDFDRGNFVRDIFSNNGGGAFPVEDAIGPMDASVYIWITSVFQLSWFDALAPYHPTAVGIYTKIPRRPAGESTTNRNKNIAGIHAGYQVLKVVYPERAAIMRQGMIALKMNPDDESQDLTTPVGIGNLAGKGVLKARLNDGMNFLGDMGRKYNGQSFDDYTGYVPVNTAYELVNPSRWQPAISPHRRRVGGGPGDKGIFMVQRFVTPQLGRVKAHTYRDPAQFQLAPPDHLDHTDRRRYKQSVDEILAASASLTDAQKVKAEFFDNKLLGITLSPRAAAMAHDLDLDGWVHLFTMTTVARFDDVIAAWYQKRKYSAVRPFSAVRHVYGTAKVTSWGGPGKGTVNDMPANEWSAFLPVGDHPDYPSGSTTLCAAEAQAARRFLGDDVLNWKSTAAAGSTLTEPGISPAKDVELRWDTWTDFLRDCGHSRVWGGVHFLTTVERSAQWGLQFGDLAYDFVQRHINGTAGR
jgi:hypothetical protein